MEVGEEGCCPTTVISGAVAGHHTEHHIGEHHGDQNHHCRRRKNAPAPPGIEVEDGSPAGSLAFSEQEAGDHETGDHEEDIDPYIATGETGNVCVIEDDKENSHRTEALDVGSEASIVRSGPRLFA